MNRAISAPLPTSNLLGFALLVSAALLALQSMWSVIFTDQNFWRTSWLLGAIFLGRHVVEWPAVFDFAAISASLAALFPVALIFVLLLSWLIRQGDLRRSVPLGALLGVVFYLLAFFVLARRYPWLSGERHPGTLISFILVGMLAGWLLQDLEQRRRAFLESIKRIGSTSH